MVAYLGQGAYAILDEFAITLAEMQDVGPPPLLTRITEAGDNDPIETYGVLHKGKATYRPTDALGFDTIDEMLRCGQVQFGMAMKESWLLSVFRNDRSYKIECKDEKLASIVQGSMKRILMRHASDFTKAMPYGVGFFEKVWDYLPAVQWGMEGVPDNEKIYGYSSVDAIHPKSIDRILYTDDGKHYAGFVQRPSHGEEISIPAARSLTLTYDKRFRNLWGIPMLEPTYVVWFWYEVALRSFLRYLERMGTPVAVCEAPSRGQVRKPDGTLWRTMKYAMLMAGNVGKSSAIALPSDVDPDTGQKLWNLSYLSADQRGAQFVEAIEMLGTLIIRSVVIGDRAVTQGSEVGSYAAANKHFQVTMLHNEHILTQFINQFNSYLIPQLAQYNVGTNAPPALMVTEGLDPDEKDRLFTLLNTMGNQADTSAMEQIDWIRILEVENIPVLSEEDVEKLREDKLAREEERMTMQQKFAAEPGAKTPFGGKKPADKAKEKAKEKVKASADWMLYNLIQGQRVPLMLSSEQAMEIVERYKERPFVVALEGEGDLTDSELALVKDEILSQLGIAEDASDDLKEAIWLMILCELMEPEPPELELSEELFIALEDYTDSIQLSLVDWIKGVVAKAKRIISSVIRKVTGKNKNWRSAVTKAYVKGAKKGAGGVIITKDGRIWRPEDHPRDAKGRFAISGKGEAKAGETEPGQTKPFTELELTAIRHDLVKRQKLPEAMADAIVNVYEKEPDLFGRATNEFRVISDEEYAKTRNVDPELIKKGWFGVYDDALQDIALSEKVALALENPGEFARKYPGTIELINKEGYQGFDLESEAYSVIIHEMLHSTTRIGEKKIKVREKDVREPHLIEARVIYEEGLTDALAMYYCSKVLGKPMTPAHVAYDDAVRITANVLHVKFDGDADKAWNWIKAAHRGGSRLETFDELIKSTFSSLIHTDYRKYLDRKDRLPTISPIQIPWDNWYDEFYKGSRGRVDLAEEWGALWLIEAEVQ